MTQTQLFTESPALAEEDPAFLSEQLVTYLGNKRALLGFIESALLAIQERTGGSRISIFDPFTGSGATARLFKRFAHTLIVNDLEDYTVPISECYIAGMNDTVRSEVRRWNLRINQTLEDPASLEEGFITDMYAPENDERIRRGERVFYTSINARRIDTARRMIAEAPQELQAFLLAPLLSEASIHANTAGVFKGFYKDRETGIGKFGGTGEHALERICGRVTVPFPVQSLFQSEVTVLQDDANKVVRRMKPVDLTYVDPPYNQHPYGSNYFMLNLITNYERPTDVSRVSGIPSNWNRSRYNKRQKARTAFWDLISRLDTKYILVSYNSEGFIAPEDIIDMLQRLGHLEVFEREYNTFRGCRNLASRPVYVNEFLFLVEVK